MPARQDTRREAARVRRLSPLQTVEDQSQAWGIRCHSCTWREGFAPSWKTELQGSYLPRGLPGSLGFLSTNGSHLDVRRIDHPVPLCPTPERLNARGRAIHDAALNGDDAPLGVALHDLCDADVAPGAQPGTPVGSGPDRSAKGLAHG